MIRNNSLFTCTAFACLTLVTTMTLLEVQPALAQQNPQPKPGAAMVNPMTMDGRVFVGYQGWATPLRQEDNTRWVHYGQRGQFGPGSSTVEMLPDVSELDPKDQVATDFRHADGSTVYVADAQNPKTTNMHFSWMKKYGIDGAFLQRFVTEASGPNQRPMLDRVLANVKAASTANQEPYGIMYDLSGTRSDDIFPHVSTDWKHLVDDFKVRKDPYYIHHRNKPVVVLWGIGFNDNRPAPGAYLSLIKWLKEDPTYGGNTVIVGVPFYWRSGDRDAVNDPALAEAIQAADVIAPWPVGRYGTPEDAANIATNERAPDIKWADEHKEDYLPGIFPGFSWHNMHTRDGVTRPGNAFNQIPRLDGKFLWSQAVTSKRAGAKMLYIAMFDEVDEGTAIFKISNQPVVGETQFLTNGGLPTDPASKTLPSDHYLWLAGQIGKMLRGEIPATDDMPVRATTPTK